MTSIYYGCTIDFIIMIEKILEKLGLSDKEIKVYLTCLSLGPSPVRKIAEQAQINRGTTYDILRSLKELGLVSYYHQDKNQYFIAEDPSKLRDTVTHKQQQLQGVMNELDEIIPQLKSRYDDAGSKPVVKYYEGSAGLKIILRDVIDACSELGDKEYYAFSSSTIKEVLYEAYKDFSKERITAGIGVKVISIGPGGETRGLDERKWLTKRESAPTYTLLYAGKVAMISIDGSGRPIGVMIEDDNIYQTQKMTFEFMWNKL